MGGLKEGGVACEWGEVGWLRMILVAVGDHVYV